MGAFVTFINTAGRPIHIRADSVIRIRREEGTKGTQLDLSSGHTQAVMGSELECLQQLEHVLRGS